MRYLLLLAPAVLLAGPPRYARVGDFAGQVETQARAPEAWIAAERNAPLPESAQVRTGAASRVEIELDEGQRGAARSEQPGRTRRTTRGYRRGSASRCSRSITGSRISRGAGGTGRAGAGGSGRAGDVHARRRVCALQVEEQWSQITVLRGGARFSSPAADMELREGQTTRVEPANAARFFFYKEVLPLELDKWSADATMRWSRRPRRRTSVQRYGLADLDRRGRVDRHAGSGRGLASEGGRRTGGRFEKDGGGGTTVSAIRGSATRRGAGCRTITAGGRGSTIWDGCGRRRRTAIFKPGEVYWLRGKNFIGWGPLAPGEQWDPADPVNALPQQFLNVNTTMPSGGPTRP